MKTLIKAEIKRCLDQDLLRRIETLENQVKKLQLEQSKGNYSVLSTFSKDDPICVQENKTLNTLPNQVHIGSPVHHKVKKQVAKMTNFKNFNNIMIIDSATSRSPSKQKKRMSSLKRGILTERSQV